MKKILAYTFVAVLLGVVTMLAPFAPFVSEMYTQTGLTLSAAPEHTQRYLPAQDYLRKAPSITEQAYGIPPATYFPDALFVAFMLALSLVIALGAMRYSKRRIAF